MYTHVYYNMVRKGLLLNFLHNTNQQSPKALASP
jgi:hypothetical protein